MKKLILLYIIGLLFISCQGQTSKEIQTVDQKIYAEKLQSIQNPQLLDVRTPEEYAIEHLNNSVNVNWNGSDFEAKASSYDRLKPIFVYCKVGGRSAQAANKLVELGFKEVYNLEGGIMKWNGEKTSVGNIKPTGMMIEEFKKIVNSEKKVMVNFSAKWCAPCQKMAPYISKMKDEMKGKINIVKLDADQNKTLLEEMKLDGLPVILIYENGKETWRNIGYISEEDLRQKL